MNDVSESKSMKRQRQAVESELTAAGLSLSEVTTINPEGGRALTSKLKGALVATVGGSLKNESYHVYDMEGAAGHHRFIQPYSGSLTLPGEHRAEIDGSTTASFKVVQPLAGPPRQLAAHHRCRHVHLWRVLGSPVCARLARPESGV